MEPQSLFLAFLQDKWNQCQDRYMITHTSFLDLAQQSAAASFFKGLLGKPSLAGPGGLPFWPAKGGPGICFYGGYPQSERNLCLFFPDYLPGESPQGKRSCKSGGEACCRPSVHRKLQIYCLPTWDTEAPSRGRNQ